MQRIVLFFLFGLFISLSFSYLPLSGANKLQEPLSSKLHVLSTIKPIHLLVKSIAGQHAESSLLISENIDMHHYTLRPSDIKKLKQANIVIRISENMETMINKLLSQKQKVISLSDTPNLQWLSIRDSHRHEHGHEHENSHEHENNHQHENSNDDPHIWLAPDNAIKMAVYIAEQLGRIDPSHSREYAENSKRLIAEIEQADQQVKKKLTNLGATPYLVFHDSWQYLEQTYGLENPRVISLHEDLAPGLKTLLNLRQLIDREGIQCLIASPFSSKKTISALTRDLTIDVVWISATGAGLATSSHPMFMTDTAAKISRCLRNSP